MSIPTLLVACLLSDPGMEDSGSALAASEFGRAGVRAFDAAVLATADPKLDPAAPPFARASSESAFSYTFLEVGYVRTDLDLIDDDAEAFYARASIGFLEYFHVFGGVAHESTNFDDATVDAYEVGGGVQLPILSQFDVVGEAAWLYNYIDSDTLFDKDTNTGVELYGGARFMVLPWSGGGLELDGGYRYTDIDSLLSDKNTSAIEVGARVHFLSHLSIGATYAFIEDDRRLYADLRFSF
jgi:hypothetical protein